MSLDYGYGPADEREFAERADLDSEDAHRTLNGPDSPYHDPEQQPGSTSLSTLGIWDGVPRASRPSIHRGARSSMSIDTLDDLIPVRRYTEESEEIKTFVLVEGGGGEVDFIINAETPEAVTISLSVEGTWKLIRQLASCAVAVEESGA